MKKPCLIALISLIPLNAIADEPHFYGRIDSGYSWSRDAGKEVEDNVNSSALFGAGIGYRFNNNLRADLTGSYRGGYNVNASIPVAGSILDVDTDISSVVGLNS